MGTKISTLEEHTDSLQVAIKPTAKRRIDGDVPPMLDELEHISTQIVIDFWQSYESDASHMVFEAHTAASVHPVTASEYWDSVTKEFEAWTETLRPGLRKLAIRGCRNRSSG